MDIDDLFHGFFIRKSDVVKETAAQKGIGQLLFVVARDQHDRPPLGFDGLLGLIDVELHAVQFEQKVVGKLDIGLVDFVDEQHQLAVRGEGIPHLAWDDVVAQVLHALIAQLAIPQPGDSVVFVEPLLRGGCGFDVPGNNGQIERLGHFMGEHGLSRSRFAFHQ